jgi:hypothetical protein
MSSWSLLLALSGFEMDGPQARVRFNPRQTPENFKCFFTGPEGWGSLTQRLDNGSQIVEVTVKSGTLAVRTLQLQAVQNMKAEKVVASIGGRKKEVTIVAKDGVVDIDFGKKFVLTHGERLEIEMS